MRCGRYTMGWAAACLVLSGCQNSYLGRWATLRGVDVDDHTRLPWRPVPIASRGGPLPTRLDSSWVSRVRPVIGERVITSVAMLDTLLETNGTRAFLVVHRDTLIMARYFHGATERSVFKCFSISKSVLSALVGIASAQGVLQASDSVGQYLALPDNPALAGVRLQHLLDNTSGFRYRRGGAPWNEQPRMYYTPDARALVRRAEVVIPPGQQFTAEDLSPILMGHVLESALRARGDTSTLSTYLAQQLWTPMGAESDARWNLDHAGDGLEKSESGLVARATDFARFGLLYLHDGRVGDRQVVPDAWVRTTVNGPPPRAPNRFREGFYHNFWWGSTRPGRTREDFYANGHFGQRIYVSPDRALVIVRLGHDAGTINWTDALADLADRWTP